jgi:hypothetical protein
MQELPAVAQFSSINDVLADDLNRDGKPDLILIGNNYAQEPMFGRYDASVGTILINEGNLHWSELNPAESNFIADRNAKYIRKIGNGTSPQYLVINNNDSSYFYQQKK